MKEAHDFQYIESENYICMQPELGADYFEEQKKVQPPVEHQDIPKSQEIQAKTPKIKKPRKFSTKNNPEQMAQQKGVKNKQKKYKCLRVDREHNPNQLFGHWSTLQNKRYHWFLEIYHSHFMNRSLRRMDKIFTSMAKFVDSRQAEQCRSHHQKMQKKHKSFSKILLNLRQSHYDTYSLEPLLDDIKANQVPILEPLLTEQFLIENPSGPIKEAPSKREQMSEDQIMGGCNNLHHYGPLLRQEGDDQEENYDNVNEIDHARVIEDVIVPDMESSSKNYFNVKVGNDGNNDFLGEGYEKNLPFNGFM